MTATVAVAVTAGITWHCPQPWRGRSARFGRRESAYAYAWRGTLRPARSPPRRRRPGRRPAWTKRHTDVGDLSRCHCGPTSAFERRKLSSRASGAAGDRIFEPWHSTAQRFNSAAGPPLARSDQRRSARLPKRPSVQGWPVEMREGALRLRRAERQAPEHAAFRVVGARCRRSLLAVISSGRNCRTPYLELYSALHQRFKLRHRCHHTQVYTCDADTCPFTHVTVPMHGPKRLAQSGLVTCKARHRPGVSQAGAESNIAARRPVRTVPPERKALSSSARTPHARTLRATPGLILRAPGRGLEPVGL